MPFLKEREAHLRHRGLDVRFVAGALCNISAPSSSHRIVTYSRHPQGESATTFRFNDMMRAPGGLIKPKELSSRQVSAVSYSLIDVLERLHRRNASAVVAVRLDIEGGEYNVMQALVKRPELLCFMSYLFIEFHHSATSEQRIGLSRYGFAPDEFDQLKTKVHSLMERPRCRLRLYWRSFWASCGDQQRFEWRDSKQATQ